MSAPRSLRPLFVTGSLAHGGAEQHSLALVNRLAERGHACHLASVKEPSTLLDQLRPGRGGTVQCLGATRYLERRAISDLAATVARIAPSVIVAQNPYALLYASAARALARSSSSVAGSLRHQFGCSVVVPGMLACSVAPSASSSCTIISRAGAAAT